MRRPHWFHALCMAATIGLPFSVAAQDSYPSRPVKVVVGFPPGSSTDVAARAVAQRMGESLGQQFVVENRPGASSNIAAKTVTAAAPDGYTLFVATIANAINVSFQPDVSVDVEKEFKPIAMVGRVPNLLVAHRSLGVKSVTELIEAAKQKPGSITFASSGNGTSPHLSGELFSSMAGIRMLHVPYRGSSQAVTDLLAGQVSLMFSPASTVLPHIRSGQLKALASTGPERTRAAPELPTIAEFGLEGFETSVWFGFVAAAGTDDAIVAKLAAATATALDSPEVQEQFKSQGIEAVKADPEAFARLIRSETDKWSKVIKSAGLKSK